MWRLRSGWIAMGVAIALSGCGDSSPSEGSLKELAHQVEAAAHNTGRGESLRQKAEHVGEVLHEAATSSEVQSAVRGALCQSIQIYEHTGAVPTDARFAQLVATSAERNHITIPQGGGLAVKNAALQLIGDARTAQQNQSLTRSAASEAITSDLACTASSLPPLDN
jgi:hypothetical protein